MTFCLMFQQILPSEKPLPCDPQTSVLWTRIWTLIVDFAHMFGELCLGVESPLLSFRASISVVKAVFMRTAEYLPFTSRFVFSYLAFFTVFGIGQRFMVVIPSQVLGQVILS
jgi:hypothetical protein